jgi:hypothetical protein
MSAFLVGLLGSIIGGCFILCVVCAARALFRESVDGQDGAPEGALHFPHFNHPHASGCKLGVRGHHKPSQGGN